MIHGPMNVKQFFGSAAAPLLKMPVLRDVTLSMWLVPEVPKAWRYLRIFKNYLPNDILLYPIRRAFS